PAPCHLNTPSLHDALPISAGAFDENKVDLALSGLPAAVEAQLRQNLDFSLKAVINATGVILHTNLGRAPLSRSVLEHVTAAATSDRKSTRLNSSHRTISYA